MNKTDNLISTIEAMLFASGDPVEASKLAEVLDIDIETVEKMLGHLSAFYDERSSGLMIIRIDNKYQICTREKYSEEVRKLMEIKKNTPLSNAAFEVLAVIAYNKTVTRSFIEQVRGVDCSGPISSLVQKGLIEEKGRMDLPGRPLIYGTTDRFLRCFSLNSLEDLPDLPKNDEIDSIAKDESQTSLFDNENKNDILKEKEISEIAHIEEE
ncbi:SMC-Scp complex subunit ScpB [uncultured Eubacterium sp.]|uniref:SMC-Scp complex subunit ScpB n=1 Tax=uncultured Eubacterium sp. TaxID=165185 RepID=UPI0028042FB9|nr:SMC-Scp complex subunit ScpB [uncultured Eubacterium sp.]